VELPEDSTLILELLMEVRDDVKVVRSLLEEEDDGAEEDDDA
jgi:hypothetical protein